MAGIQYQKHSAPHLRLNNNNKAEAATTSTTRGCYKNVKVQKAILVTNKEVEATEKRANCCYPKASGLYSLLPWPAQAHTWMKA